MKNIHVIPTNKPNWLLNGDVVDNQHIEVIGSVDSSLYKIN